MIFQFMHIYLVGALKASKSDVLNQLEGLQFTFRKFKKKNSKKEKRKNKRKRTKQPRTNLQESNEESSRRNDNDFLIL